MVPHPDRHGHRVLHGLADQHLADPARDQGGDVDGRRASHPISGRCACTRAAVAIPQRPVVASATTMTTRAKATGTGQPAKPAPRAARGLPATVAAPSSATPSVWPTWRLVDATAAATPACA